MKQDRATIEREALQNAVGNSSLTNYPAIYQGFIDKGISEDQIKPRENVFTYNAWRALGRQVRKGEHGVKVITWIVINRDTDEARRMPHTTTVFHVSQTDAIAERAQ